MSRASRRPKKRFRRSFKKRRKGKFSIGSNRGHVTSTTTVNKLSYKKPRMSKRGIDKLFRHRTPVWKGWHNHSKDGGPQPYTYVKQNYAETVLLGDGALTIPFQEYRTNSVWDPNQTGVGGQPNGYNKMANMYQNYIVKGCKYTVTFRGRATTLLTCCAAFATATPASSLVDDYHDALERPDVVTCLVEPKAQGTARSIRTITGYVENKNFTPTSLLEYWTFQQAQAADIAANPPFVVTLKLLALHVDGGALVTNAIGCDVQLQYDVIYFNPKDTEDN